MRHIPIFLSLFLFTAPALAADDVVTSNAKYIAIMDGGTGQLLYGRDADVAMPPASMSKLMTAYEVFDRIDNGKLSMDDRLLVSENAWRKGGSKMFVRVGDTVRVEDLLKGVIIQSGNDACIVLAEGLSGSEESFAAALTRKAEEIGLENSTFGNATGWPHPKQRMSAHDLAKLARMIIKNHPDAMAMYGANSFTYNKITQGNRNPLLGTFPGADGMKTGHTEESGYGLVGTAIQDGKRRIIVFNGTNSKQERADEARNLMTQAFHDFQFVPLFTKGDTVGQAYVIRGSKRTVDLVAADDITFGLHTSARQSMTAEIVYKGPLKAGFKQGDTVAHLIISADGRGEERFPLTAAQDVGKAWLLGPVAAGWRRIFGGNQPKHTPSDE